jgi:hypothetical protein
MRRICCVCQRIEQEGEWRSALFLSVDEMVTHGYCPECFDEAMAAVEELMGELVSGAQPLSGWSSMQGQESRCV